MQTYQLPQAQKHFSNPNEVFWVFTMTMMYCLHMKPAGSSKTLTIRYKTVINHTTHICHWHN